MSKKRAAMTTKVPKSDDAPKRTKRRRSKDDSYASYIYRVAKQTNPSLSMSKGAMAVLSSMVEDIERKIAEEAAHKARFTKRKTLTEREIQTSVREILRGDLCKHAVAHGAKALKAYKDSE
jgi:histone H2B